MVLKSDAINEAIAELKTLRDMLRWGVSQLESAQLHYGHGTDNAWDEMLSIIAYALHLSPEINPKLLPARLTRSEKKIIAELLQKRINERTPLPYLTRQAWFAGLSFYVDERVLIPRSPLAELIQNQFSPWIEETAIKNILDLCTGSGCLAIACAQAIPEAQVDAVDISVDALTVAKINVERHVLHEQVNLIQSDLFKAIPARKYDVIISNPPYVDVQDMATLPQEYKHEPALALAAGDDGLIIVKRIIVHAKQYLADHGVLIVEVGNSEIALVEQFPQVPFTWLEFACGGDGVFLLTAAQVKHYAHLFENNHV